MSTGATAITAPLVKERLFAYPNRPNSYAAGGDNQLGTATPAEAQQIGASMGLTPAEVTQALSQAGPPASTSPSSSSSSGSGLFGSGIGPNVGPDLNPVDAVSSLFSGFLSYVEASLTKAALYAVLIIGGIGLAVYGLTRTFSAVPQPGGGAA